MNHDSGFAIHHRFTVMLAVIASAFIVHPSAFSFEGRITVTLIRGGETQTLLYTVGEKQIRIERTDTDWPHAKTIVDLDTGAVTLLFPHNHSYVRLKAASRETAPAFPGAPPMPLPQRGLPPGIGPRTTPGAAPALPSAPRAATAPGAPAPSDVPKSPQLPPGIGPRNTPSAAGVPGAPAAPALPATSPLPPGIGPQPQPGIAATPGIPAMPMMPPMPMEQVELKATDERKEILGFPCTRYELKQRGEVMEVWATDKLVPFQPWLANQPPRFGPRRLEEQWGGMLKEKKLFPLLVILKFEGGPERMRFEVKSVTPEKITDEKLFQPPADYHELQPLPF